MQYNQDTDKVAMMNSSYITVPKPLLLTEDREVQRTRKILIIILGVCLGLCVVALVSMVFGSALTTEMNGTQRSIKVGQAIIAILFYGFGIFVARRYSAIGLRVFAWLNIIELVAMGIGIVLLVFVMIMGVSVINYAAVVYGQMKDLLVGATEGTFIFTIIIYIAAFVLLVIIVKLTFKLARAIDANQRLIIQQA
jgi:hypothetical protein